MIPERNYFWGIQSGWLFYVLAAITLAIFAFGIRNHISIWAKGIRCQSIPLSGQWVLNVCLEGLFGRRIFKGDPSAGVMHLLILWGFLGLFLGTLLLAIDHYFFEFLKGPVYLGYSLCLDIAGLMLTIGLIWALMRRYVLRLARLERRIEDWAVVVWLIAVALSGFVVEGLRLAAQRPAWGNWSFAGYGISFLFPEVKNLASLYPFFWWGHSLLSLGFIAMIPYSKLLHVLTAPVSIYLKDQPLQAVSLETREDGESTFSYRELISFDACTRCGRCAEVCPSTGILSLKPEHP